MKHTITNSSSFILLKAGNNYMKTTIAYFFAILFFSLHLQHNSLNAMEIQKSDNNRTNPWLSNNTINSWLLKKQSLKPQNTVQKCPRTIPELVQSVAIEKKLTKQIIKQNPIQAQKNPGTEPLRLIKQKTIATEKKHICDECDKGFTQKCDLSVHKKTVHSDERPYSCDECNETFKTPTNLNRHKDDMHSAEKPYSCNLCDKTYKRQHHLTEHQTSAHLGASHVCSICNKNFTWPQSLACHLETHSENRAYACTMCPASFTTNGYLSKHIKIHSKKGSVRAKHPNTKTKKKI